MSDTKEVNEKKKNNKQATKTTKTATAAKKTTAKKTTTTKKSTTKKATTKSTSAAKKTTSSTAKKASASTKTAAKKTTTAASKTKKTTTATKKTTASKSKTATKKKDDVVLEVVTPNKKGTKKKDDVVIEIVAPNVVVNKDNKKVVSKIKVPTVVDKSKKETSKLNTEAKDKTLIKKDEETIIDKIKNFLKKIIEMQSEHKADAEGSTKEKKARKKVSEKVVRKPNYMLEYYDLPYRYNETVVKVLAQSPNRLFVYWDISDNDRQKYVETFGDNFFNDTYPVLLLYNEDKNYIREIPINDFANSWYIDIDNPKTKYSIQLGRKFKSKPEFINIAKFEQENVILHNDYLPFANSNKIEAPNDHILFESFSNKIKFRNVKTNQEIIKDISELAGKISKAYNIASFKDMFREVYKGEELSDDRFTLKNPASGNPTSSFK